MKHRLRLLGVLGLGAVLSSACSEGPSPLSNGYDEALRVETGPSFVLGVPEIVDDLSQLDVGAATGMVANGAGLFGGVPTAQIQASVPPGATIVGAYLYWGARGDDVDPSEIVVEKDLVSVMVTGAYAGESVIPGPDSHTLRVDLFPLFGDWSAETQTVDIDVPTDEGIEGASLVLLYTESTPGSLLLWDGNDFAYLLDGLETQERNFDFAMSTEERDADLWVIVGDVEGTRPHRLDYEVDGGAIGSVENPFGEGSPTRNGPEWDTYLMDLTIPAGSQSVRVQLFSENNGTGIGDPASMYWVVGALQIADPPPPPPPPGGGEGCTPGYWKQQQHFDSWTDYDPGDVFDDVFGVSAEAFGDMTLLEVLKQGGGGLKALGRHAVAALLNAASGGVSYDLTTTEVIDAFNAIHPGASKQEYNALKDEFAGFNEQGCPLN